MSAVTYLFYSFLVELFYKGGTKMKPLSYWVYFKNNKRKLLGIILSIAFSMALIGEIQMFMNNMTDNNARDIEKYKYMSTIMSTKDMIPTDIMEKIRTNKTIDKMIRVNVHWYMLSNIFGTENCEGFNVDAKNIKYLMDNMGLKLTEGSFPQNNEKKIIINENVATSRGIRLGGYVGRDLRHLDSGIYGKYQVCGITKGNNIISFIAEPEGKIATNNTQYEEYVLIPKVGQLKKMNNFLRTLPVKGIKITTYDTGFDDLMFDTKNFDSIFNIVIIIIMLVMAVALGNSSYVHYFQRRREFGLLKAIGYKKSTILLIMMKEIGISCLIGFILGFITLLLLRWLNDFLFVYNKGLSNFKIDINLFPRIIAIPLFIGIFSMIPISRMLIKIEPISIIERVN